jgi:hypothetical protein
MPPKVLVLSNVHVDSTCTTPPQPTARCACNLRQLAMPTPPDNSYQPDNPQQILLLNTSSAVLSALRGNAGNWQSQQTHQVVGGNMFLWLRHMLDADRAAHMRITRCRTRQCQNTDSSASCRCMLLQNSGCSDLKTYARRHT